MIQKKKLMIGGILVLGMAIGAVLGTSRIMAGTASATATAVSHTKESAAGTADDLLLIPEEADNLPLTSVGADNLPPTSAKEISAFEQAATQLKEQALEGVWPANVETVGKELMRLLSSPNGDLITNDTFHDQRFSVSVTEHPLQNGHLLRVVQYVLRDGENISPYYYEMEENAYFLQYTGDKTFFSEIESVSRPVMDKIAELSYTDYKYNENEAIKEIDNNWIQVFENTDGIFCFAMLPYAPYPYDQNFFLLHESTFMTVEDVMEYRPVVFYLAEDRFEREEPDIPLLVRSDDRLRLVQRGETIQCILEESGEINEDAFECIFNGATRSFDIAGSDLKGGPVAYDFPALLLGLSDTQGKIRTLLISREEDGIYCEEYPGQIIFPRDGELFSLRNHELHETVQIELEEGAEVDFLIHSRVDIQKLFCAPFGTDTTEDFEQMFLPLPEWGYYGLTNIPLFIGTDYICYVRQKSYSGGGSFHMSESEVCFERLDGLADFTNDYDAEFSFSSPDFEQIFLAELIYGKEAAESMYQDVFTNSSGSGTPYFDFTQLAIKRNQGKWSLMLPVQHYSAHPGNGSEDIRISSFASYSDELPDFLNTGAGDIDLRGSFAYWYGKDYLQFPQSSAILGQHDYHIEIGEAIMDSPENPSGLKIPVKLDEFIVSVYFAEEGMQAALKEALAGA